jgi:hypothetical protein
MNTNLNTNPYYDDFQSSKNFHQILFKPGYAVQARELTQLQTILRDQIAKFGNHIFQHGSVVLPGNSFSDLFVPFIKVEQVSGGNVDFTQFQNTVVTTPNGIRAKVKFVLGNIFYLGYLSGSNNARIANEFVADEEIYREDSVAMKVKLLSSGANGYGSMAFINKGVFYINGAFVSVDAQSIVISPESSVPSCRVLLNIVNTIVTSDTDETLLDPAQGSYNYSAPGADRLQTNLILSTLPLTTPVSSDYVEIMRYVDGNLEEHSLYPKYSELEKSLAIRTFDESGNYVVGGFEPMVVDHLKTRYNDGVYLDGDLSKFILKVSAGKAYINGFGIDLSGVTNIVCDKARTSDHTKLTTINTSATYGRYMFVTDLKSLPDFKIRQVVNLFNAHQPSELSASNIGTCRVHSIEYHSGDPSTDGAIYKLFFSDVVMTSTNELVDVGGVRFDSAGSMTVLSKFTVNNASLDFVTGDIVSNVGGIRSATVKKFNRSMGELFVYRHDYTKRIPFNSEIISGTTTGNPSGLISSRDISYTVGAIPIFAVPVQSIKSVKNIDNIYDMSYSVWETLVINTNGSGVGSVSISNGTFDDIGVNNTVAVSPSGIVLLSHLSVSSGNTLSISGGPVSSRVVITIRVNKTGVSAKTKTLTTAVLSTVAVAPIISLGKSDIYKINSIFSGPIDVTDRFILDNGQTDLCYDIGKLRLMGVAPSIPLTISFDYFLHSGAGDYFSIDSYQTLGANYIAMVPSYTSPTTSANYDLSNYLDFRPRMGDGGTFISANASVNDVIVVNSNIHTSVQFFVPRIDVVCVGQNREVSVKTGIPAASPQKPNIPVGALELFSMFVPAYTDSVNNILVKKAKNTRMTMTDMNSLKDRVYDIEQFSTLTASENALLSFNVVDASTGLNRYKTGYLVETFANPFTIADTLNPLVRMDFISNRLSTAIEKHTAALVIDPTASSNYMVTNGQISLPYTEVPLVSQKTSTRATNVNPFFVLSWEGMMTITPPVDSWVETDELHKVVSTPGSNIAIDSPVRTTAPDSGNSGAYDPTPNTNSITERWDSSMNNTGVSDIAVWTSTGGAIGVRETSTGLSGTITGINGQVTTEASAVDYVTATLATSGANDVYASAVAWGISSTSLDALMQWAPGTSAAWASSTGNTAF